MKKNLLPLLFLISSTCGFAQAPVIQWQKSLGGSAADKGNAIRQTSNGGYIMAGETNSSDGDVANMLNSGSTDYWVVRLDTNGALLWQKSLGGSSDDRANDVIPTSDGGYVVVGTSSSSDGDISGPKGNYDFWIVKLTATGTVSWKKNMGGTNIDEAKSVQQTSDGGFIIAGDTRSNNYDVTLNNGNTDFWVVKTDATGTIQWQKSLGGSGTDNANSIQQTSDGGYIVCGQTDSNNDDVSGNNGGVDYWVVKLSSTGSLTWQKCLGGTSTDVASSVKQTSDGGYIVAGKTDSNDGNVSGNNGAENAWVVKLTSTGTISWQKCLGGSAFEGANSIQQTIDGGYIFGGAASSNSNDVSGNHGSYDVWAVKLSSAGALQWQKCLGGTGSDTGTGIQQTTDNGYIMSARASSTNGDITNPKGLDDFWAVKFVGIPTNTTSPTTGISELNNDEQFSLYPNPASGVITFVNKMQTQDVYKIQVNDALGKLVYENKTSADKFTFDLSAMAPKGIYILSVSDLNGHIITAKKLVLN